MNLTLDNNNDDNRDFMVLSKGHASLAHASILEEKGFITKKQLMSFVHAIVFSGHLSRKKVPGVRLQQALLVMGFLYP